MCSCRIGCWYKISSSSLTLLWSMISTIVASLPASAPLLTRTTRPISTNLQLEALTVVSVDIVVFVVGWVDEEGEIWSGFCRNELKHTHRKGKAERWCEKKKFRQNCFLFECVRLGARTLDLNGNNAYAIFTLFAPAKIVAYICNLLLSKSREAVSFHFGTL